MRRAGAMLVCESKGEPVKTTFRVVVFIVIWSMHYPFNIVLFSIAHAQIGRDAGVRERGEPA
jgi:hypothetical protein